MIRKTKLTINELLNASRKMLKRHRISDCSSAACEVAADYPDPVGGFGTRTPQRGRWQYSAKAELPTYNLAIEVLLAHILKSDRLFLYERNDLVLNNRQIRNYYSALNKFIKGMPLSYLTGKAEFMGLPFSVNRHVLIPRPDTEVLVEEVLRLISTRNDSELILRTVLTGGCALSPQDESVALDIGTGCGNIAVAVAKLSSKNKICVFASDISRNALKIAKHNAVLNNVAEKITFCHGNLFQAFKPYSLAGKADFILSNPPYVTPEEGKRLPISVRKYEPAIALYTTNDGLEFHKQIIIQSSDYLKKGGYLLLETGLRQARRVAGIMKSTALFSGIRIIPDYNKKPRLVCGRYLQ